jgi:hypothetical protein
MVTKHGVAANPQPTHSWDRHGDRVPNADTLSSTPAAPQPDGLP